VFQQLVVHIFLGPDNSKRDGVHNRQVTFQEPDDMPTQQSELTPQQRMAQVAAILARGVLRLKQDASRVPASPPEEVPEASKEDLESGANPRLSVSRRYGF
jgi:hypothetical protein